MTSPDLVIGGAGLFGLTVAERAAAHGLNILVVEKRTRVGGNAASHVDERTGIEVHDFGSHIFHTSNDRVWEYLARFTEFVPYTHRVRTVTGGRVLPLPLNLATVCAFYDRPFTPAQARARILADAEGIDPGTATTLEDRAVGSIGRPLYNALILGYTMKQWGRHPRELPAETIARLPVRYTFDDAYFTDTHQGIPADGYQAWLERMATHPRITVELEQDAIGDNRGAPLLHTGPIDAYFGHCHGRLSWRSVQLDKDHPDTGDFQGCPVLNYADPGVPFTRIHEYKHFRPDRPAEGTVIHRETSHDTQPGETPAYPVNTPQDRERLAAYRADAAQLPALWFGGRLGTYKYLDMHAAVASALTLWNNTIRPYFTKDPS